MLDQKTRELIAIGASVASKCQPCLEYHITEARNAGANDDEMRNAIRIAQTVTQMSEENMTKFTSTKLNEDPSNSCGCSCHCSENKDA